MLESADRDIDEIIRFFSTRGLDAGYLVPTETGLSKSIMDAHRQLSNYFRKMDLHDYSFQEKGVGAKSIIKTWFVKEDCLVETKSSLYRPESKSGDPRIWIYDLNKHAIAGNLLALLIREREIYVVNASDKALLESANNPASPFGQLLDLLIGAKSKPLNDRFSEWNLRLLRSFFSEASRDEEVFLRVDKDFLDQIGQDIGGDAGFLEAVRTGPAWINSNTSFVRSVISLVKQRRKPGYNYKAPGHFDSTYKHFYAPAYLPYLAALVRNDSENADSYYAGLNSDLKLKHHFGTKEMKVIERAWEDLQRWTEVNHGRFGFFKLRRLGGYRLISVPRSQSILKPSDVEELSRVFVQAEIKPGQKLSEDSWSRILNEARAIAPIFSAGFQQALGVPDFEQPILSAIRTAYSDWDGTLPVRSKNGVRLSPSSGLSGGQDELSIGISLVVLQQAPLSFSPRWRVPAIQDSGKFELTYNSLAWFGQFAGVEGANAAGSAGQDADIWRFAELTRDTALRFNLRCSTNDDAEAETLEILLKKQLLWVLTPVIDGLTGNVELREGDLPASGSVFLLAPPHNVSSLESYLERENPEHERMVAVGLPENWLLVRLVECSSLTEDQRLLPDGDSQARPTPRSIRFGGGRSIRRGYSRMYLPYDLPFLELDAPEGSAVVSSSDVEIEEIFADNILTEQGKSILKPLRRFKIKLSSSSSKSYEFSVIAPDGKTLGQARLRIAGLAGELVETDGKFSLDEFGRMTSSADGLSGVELSSFSEAPLQSSVPLDGQELDKAALGVQIVQENLAFGVCEKFLDALAQSGGLDYGVARDLLLRLILSSGESGEPAHILLDLCRRGHIEIARTHRGHMARIHSVKPTLYSLPLKHNGKPIWAVAGTLRISHWSAIASQTAVWSAHRLMQCEAALQPWRLAIVEESEALKLCCEIGFKFVDMPCVTVANWSACLGTFRDEAFHSTMESIGGARESAMRLNASTGLFTAPANGRFCELWKVPDLDLGGRSVYLLADKEGYAFVRDSRWGVWLALDAFAIWLKNMPGMGDIHPVPLVYDVGNKAVWIPARIGLPSLLERALVLCSGKPPDVIPLKEQNLDQMGGRLLLSSGGDRQALLSTDPFYKDMARGRWLSYGGVPEEVARLVAGKLGARLDDF